ncbi:unnamed protein product [Brassica rapa subsp. trilocularis]
MRLQISGKVSTPMKKYHMLNVKSNQMTFITKLISHTPCFLKTCHLCMKQLHQDKDIFMYRGDLGFCSRECRESQILIDEKKELEASTKMMLAAYRRCNSGENRTLLNDLRRRRQLFIVP